MAKGNYTALQQLRPINVDWGEVAATGVRRQDEKYRRQKAEEAAEKDRRDKLGYDPLDPVVTGITSLDEALAIGVQNAAMQQHEDYKRALDDPSYSESSEYKIRTKNFNSYSKNLALLSQKGTALYGEIKKRQENDTLTNWDNQLLQKLNSVFVNPKVAFGSNEDGSIKVRMALTDSSEVTEENPQGYVYDENGNPKMITTTAANIMKGLDGFSITEKVNSAEVAQKRGTSLGQESVDNISGRTTTSIQNWETKKEEIRGAIRAELGTEKNPTALAKNIWATDLGKSSRNLNEDDMKLIEDTYLDQIGIYYDNFVKKRKSFTQPKGGPNDPVVTPGEGIEVATTGTGNPLTWLHSSGKSIGFTLPTVKDEKKGISSPKVVLDLNGVETSIETLYLLEDDRVHFEGWADDMKETRARQEGLETIEEGGQDFTTGQGGTKVTEVRNKRKKVDSELGSTDLSKIARALGFDNSYELTQFLKYKEQEFLRKLEDRKKAEKQEEGSSSSGELDNL